MANDESHAPRARPEDPAHIFIHVGPSFRMGTCTRMGLQHIHTKSWPRRNSAPEIGKIFHYLPSPKKRKTEVER